MNVRVVMPRGPKYSSRLGEASQCSTSSTSWVISSVVMRRRCPRTKHDRNSHSELPPCTIVANHQRAAQRARSGTCAAAAGRTTMPATTTVPIVAAEAPLSTIERWRGLSRLRAQRTYAIFVAMNPFDVEDALARNYARGRPYYHPQALQAAFGI